MTLVAQVFDVKSKNASKVYGVRIMEGSLKSSDVVRVTRAGEVLGEAKLTSLRHFKEQVTFGAFFPQRLFLI